jgi:hypothetical protein
MRWHRTLAVFPVWLAAFGAHAAERPSYDAYRDHAPQRHAPVAAPALVGVTSRDALRDVPTFAWARGGRQAAPAGVAQNPEAVARHFLSALAPAYRVPAAAVDGMRARAIHDTGRGGIVVSFRPFVEGIEVFRSDTKVLLTRNLELVAVGGNMRPEL